MPARSWSAVSATWSASGTGGWPLFVILSREQAKLSYRWKAAIVTRAVSGSRVLRGEDGLPLRRVCCPACFAPVVDDEGVPLEEADLRRKKLSCERCRSPLWQADCHGPRRFPLADYITQAECPGSSTCCSSMSSTNTRLAARPKGSAGTLATACGAVLTLTGTLMGGYASTLFYLLWRFSPGVREEFQYNDEPKWVSRYGIVERITRRNGDDDAYEDGRSSRRRSYRTRVVEKPGVSPAVLFHLIGNTAFLRLTDVASGLTEYTEEVRLVGLETVPPGEPFAGLVLPQARRRA